MRNSRTEWRSRRWTAHGGETVAAANPVATVARTQPTASARIAGTQAFDEEAATGGSQPWRYVRWSLLYITFLAYIFVATTSRFPIGKIAMVLALVGLVFEPGRLRVPRVLLWLGGFVLWAAVGLMVTPYPEEVMERVLEVAKVWLIALAAANSLTTRPRIRMYVIAFCGFFAIYPVRGTILNYLSGNTFFGRAAWNHMFSNPNDLAAMTLLQLSMVAGLLASGVKGWLRWTCLAGAVLLPLVILLTQSRAVLIASSVFAFALLIAQRRRLRPTVLLAVAAMLAVLAYFAPSGVWDRLSGLRHVTDRSQLSQVDAEGSARQRFEIWRIASKVASDHPVMGVGLGAYQKVHATYALSEEFDRTGRGERDAHSTYLRLLAETGVIGLVLFLGLIVAVVRFAEGVRRRAKRLLPGSAQFLLYLELGLLGFLIAGIWGSYAHLAFTYLHLVLIWCAADVARRDLDRIGSGVPVGPAGGRAR